MMRILLVCAVLQAVHSYELIADRLFHTPEHPDLRLQCGDYTWDKYTNISFYRQNKQLIFSSFMNIDFPLIKKTELNKFVHLNVDKVQGWLDLYCIMNDSRSLNDLSIPYIAAPTFSIKPMPYELGQSFDLSCKGFVQPPMGLRTRFVFESFTAAMLVDSQVQMGNTPGLSVHFTRLGNDTVRVTPTVNSNFGKYSCQFEFDIPDAKIIMAPSVNSIVTVDPVKEFKLLSTRYYYSSRVSDIASTCGKLHWNSKSNIKFFSEDILIFDSNSTEKFPLVLQTNDSNTIMLNSSGIRGWKDLSCTVNKVKSQNRLTIPYVDGPTLLRSPETFKLNQRFTLSCVGYIAMSSLQAIDFKLNGTRFARLSNGKLTKFDIIGLLVGEFGNSNYTIYVDPIEPESYGVYECAFVFESSLGTETAPSDQWNVTKDTNAGGSLIVELFVLTFVVSLSLLINR